MKFQLKLVAIAAFVAYSGSSFAQATPAKPAAKPAAAKAAASGPLAGQTVKMVRIDALTGLLGPVGNSQFKGYQFFAEKFSGSGNPAGVNFEITAIDNKLSPAKA